MATTQSQLPPPEAVAWKWVPGRHAGNYVMNPMMSDIEYLGGTERIVCTWSGCTLISSTSTRSFCRVKWYICCLAYLPIWPSNILCLYFGQNTIWYLHSYIVCDNFLKLLIIMYLPLQRTFQGGTFIPLILNKLVEPIQGTTTRGSGLSRLINILALLKI